MNSVESPNYFQNYYTNAIGVVTPTTKKGSNIQAFFVVFFEFRIYSTMVICDQGTCSKVSEFFSLCGHIADLIYS